MHDTTFYKCNSQNLQDQNLVAGLSSDLVQVAQWGKGRLLKSNAAQTKLVTFPHQRVETEISAIMMDRSSVEEDP